MKGKSIAILVLLALNVATLVGAYFQFRNMIPLSEHQQELASLRRELEAKYKKDVGEELHRREMRLLFEQSTARAIDAQGQAQRAALEISSLDGAISMATLTPFLFQEGDSADLKAAQEVIDALRRGDQDSASEARERSRQRNEELQREKQQRNDAKLERLKQEKVRWIEKHDAALSAFGTALADMKYAKGELERMGCSLDWPPFVMEYFQGASAD